MNSNFRNLAIWVVIALLLVALFNLFQGPGQSRRGNEISYSDFLAGVDSGNIADVTIAKHRITGTYRDKSGNFTTVPPEDPGLVSRLEKKNVKITARAPDEDVPSILGVLVNWFPMLLLIGVWIFFMRQMQSGSRPRHGLRQVQGQAADRAPGPRHVRGRGRRRRGQGRPAGDRRVPARSAEVPAARRAHSARRAAGRPAGHRQDADRARRRRRGQRAVLHDLGLRLRRDVRRRRR